MMGSAAGVTTLPLIPLPKIDIVAINLRIFDIIPIATR